MYNQKKGLPLYQQNETIIKINIMELIFTSSLFNYLKNNNVVELNEKRLHKDIITGCYIIRYRNGLIIKTNSLNEAVKKMNK